MKEKYTLKTRISTIFTMALVMLFLSNSVYADPACTGQVPCIPKLNLVGDVDSYDVSWYPDGKIKIPVSSDGPREFYMPVFIQNNWKITEWKQLGKDDTVMFYPEPIKSFKFTMFYHNEAVEPIGIVTDKHPQEFVEQGRNGTEYDISANNFTVDWNIAKTSRYYEVLRPNVPANDKKNGKAITFTGYSNGSFGLPESEDSEYRILFYVKFRVIPKLGTLPSQGAQFSPIYIDNDVIKYNDMVVTKEQPFKEHKKYLSVSQLNRYETSWYPMPPSPAHTHFDSNPTKYFPGVTGMNNWDLDPSLINQYGPVIPGNVWLEFMNTVPELEFDMARGIGGDVNGDHIIPTKVETYRSDNGAIDRQVITEFALVDPLTIDLNSIDPSTAERIVELRILSTIDQVIANDIVIESDAAWLKFTTVAGPQNRNPFTSERRKGYLNFLENGVLRPGETDQLNNDPPLGNNTRGDIFLNIICDPSVLMQEDGEEGNDDKTGIYTGYITASSKNSLNDPVRLKVTFILFDIADEGGWDDRYNGQITGIKLDIENSRGAVGDKTSLVFGTAPRGTDGVDSLFGEYAYSSDFTGFGARFYPLDADNPARYGFGDFASNDEMRRTASRDIRSKYDTTESIIYHVKFNADGDDNYPVVLTWNTRDFLPGSQLFIKDVVNGNLFDPIDMLTATDNGNGFRSYTIRDRQINEFLIEYTLPKTIDFLDEFGNPIIKEGWNLLSIPVNPVNKFYKDFYRGAKNPPYYFSAEDYNQEQSGNLREGVGYFVQYGSQIDVTFSGSFINEISAARGNAVPVYRRSGGGNGGRAGWNSVGTVSCPISVDKIEFSGIGNEAIPSADAARASGIWKYTPGRGYSEVTEMLPGFGYWVKVDNDGFYQLRVDPGDCSAKSTINSYISPKELVYNKSAKIHLIDNQSRSSVLYSSKDASLNLSNYEIPTALNDNSFFDIRYTDGTNMNIVNDNKDAVIRVQGATYPMALRVSNSDADYTFYDDQTNQVIGTIAAGSDASLFVNNGTKFIRFEKTNNAINEFHAELRVNKVFVSVEESQLVTIELYNQMGHKVMDLYNDVINGSNGVDINTNLLSQGSYICKVTAGKFSKVLKVSVVK